MTHVIVQYVEQPPLWLAALPFGGSVLLFIAAMITLAMTIKSTNTRAKDDRDAAQERANADRLAARQREFDAWRRDTLLRVGFEAMEAAHAVQEHFRAIAHETTPANLPPQLDAIEAEVKRISASFFNLRLIGAHEVAEQCRLLNKALGNRNLQRASLDCHRASRKSDESERASEPAGAAAAALLRERLETLMQPVDEAREKFGDAIEDELKKLSPSKAAIDQEADNDGYRPTD